MARAHKRSAPTRSDALSDAYRQWLADELDDDDVAEELRLGDDETPDPFVDLIQRDPVVCDSCFLLRYDVVSCEWYRGSFGWLDYERWVARPGRSEEVPHELAARGTSLVCKNCGVTGDLKHRPIPAHVIDEVVDNLSSTLRSKGIDHDADVLHARVAEYNTSDHQGKQDTHVFAPAVEAAIRAVQGRTEAAPVASASD